MTRSLIDPRTTRSLSHEPSDSSLRLSNRIKWQVEFYRPHQHKTSLYEFDRYERNASSLVSSIRIYEQLRTQTIELICCQLDKMFRYILSFNKTSLFINDKSSFLTEKNITKFPQTILVRSNPFEEQKKKEKLNFDIK